MNQFPVTWAALGILFRLGWVIERKLDVMEGTQVMVFQNGNTVTVGSDGELYRSSSQVSQYSLVVRMHSVLARSQIHRANRTPSDHHARLGISGTRPESGPQIAKLLPGSGQHNHSRLRDAFLSRRSHANVLVVLQRAGNVP